MNPSQYIQCHIGGLSSTCLFTISDRAFPVVADRTRSGCDWLMHRPICGCRPDPDFNLTLTTDASTHYTVLFWKYKGAKNAPHCRSSLPFRTNHPLPSIQSLTFFQHKFSGQTYTGITSNFTSRAFSVSAPSTWNSLPTHIRSLDKLSTFKRQLKSHLFQSAFAA